MIKVPNPPREGDQTLRMSTRLHHHPLTEKALGRRVLEHLREWKPLRSNLTLMGTFWCLITLQEST